MEEGTELLHYRILSRLGEGGMGVVYRAEDTRLGRIVALKLLRRDLAGDEDWTRRFQREVRAASAMSHPGIATLYDYHVEGDTAFYTMEFVEGENLREKLRFGPLPIRVALEAAVQMADALSEAHRRGIVHRDLKPENVMASASGFYKILDFGLARFDPESAGLQGGSMMDTLSRNATQLGRLIGTVAYMSPEQAQGNPVDARSDVFAFGTLLYELVIGAAPFLRKTPVATFHAIVHEATPKMSSNRPEVPRELDWIVARCLAKDPAERYPSAVELTADLRSLADGDASGIRRILPVEPGSRTGSPLRRWGWIAAGALALAIAAIGLPRWVEREAGSPGTRSAEWVFGKETWRGGSLVVAPFVNNTGDPEAGWLGRGLAEMLTTELSGAGGLTVLSTQKLEELAGIAGRAGGPPLDAASASEMARWVGAATVITGSIFRAGDVYRVDAQALDTTTGRVVAATKAQGADFFAMVADLTTGLIDGLGVGTAGSGRPEAEAITASEEALRHYTEGIAHYDDLRLGDGIESFRRSVEVDPNFGLARLRLGMSLWLDGRKEEARSELDRMRSEGGGRLPARARRLLRILTTSPEHPGDEDTDPESGLALGAPDDDPETLLWRALSMAEEGERVEAIHLLSEVVAKEPENLAAVAELARRLAEIGNARGAARLLRQYASDRPEAAPALDALIETLDLPEEPPTPASPPSP